MQETRPDLARARQYWLPIERLFRYAKEFRISRIETEREVMRDGAELLSDMLPAILDELEQVRAQQDGARERLARHLYMRDSSLEREAGQRWDAGQVSQSRMDDYRRAADRALAAISGNEE